MTEAPRLVVRGLAKRYGSRRVLGPLDLEVASGTLVAIMGSNGVGKSTLLGGIAGTLACDGAIDWDDAPLGPSAGRSAYLPQRIRLPGTATVAEVVALFREFTGGAPDRVDLAPGFLPDQERRIGELSGGQAQRVAIACVTRGAPDLLLLDEPFSNLDDEGRAEVARLVRSHRDAGAMVMIASPAALDLLAICDDVVEVKGGEISFRGSPTEYRARLESGGPVAPVQLA